MRELVFARSRMVTATDVRGAMVSAWVTDQADQGGNEDPPRFGRGAADQLAARRLTALVWRNIVEMKVRELIRLLRADGWYLARSRGSHNQFKHPTKAGVVTVAGSGSDDLAPKTLNSILKQARLKP